MMESNLTQKDTQGIPLELGNRHERRFLAKQNRKLGISPDAHAQFEKEPIWRAMEKVMKHLKAWYAMNGNWIFTDSEAMAVLNDMRKDHEKREEDIRIKVSAALEAEHKKLDETFAKVEDKKILQNQLKSMREELQTLEKLAKLRTADRQKK